MSLGNLDTQGDKKSNINWQKRVLQLLGSIAGEGNTSPNRTPSLKVFTGPGNTDVGARSVSIYVSGVAAGVIGGTPVLPNEIYNFSDPDGLKALSFDATGTEFKISTVI